MSKIIYFIRKKLYFLLYDLYYSILNKAEYISLHWEQSDNVIRAIADRFATKEIVHEYNTKFHKELGNSDEFILREVTIPNDIEKLESQLLSN